MMIDVKPEQREKAQSPILAILYSTSFMTMDDGISTLPEYEALYCSLYVTSAVFSVSFRL